MHMNPLALGSIAIGILLLLIGISSLMKNKRTRGWVFSILGLLAIATPFIATYLIAE
jgi:hypothetical protein